MTGHDYWDELAAGYALHGLSGDEETAFVDHLSTCAECAASLRDHELVAAQLGAIAHYPDDAADAPSWEAMRAAIITTEDSGVVVDLGERRHRYAMSRRWLGAAAALVIAAGGGITAWQVASHGGSSCQASDGCHVVTLEASGRTAADLTIRGDTVTMRPTAMPNPPAGKEYVLWQQPRNRRMAAIRAFTAGNGTTVTAHLVAPYAETQRFAVSLEPAGPPPATPSNAIASGLAG
jgi:hypothetical protein